jgi:hypothetical protein
MCAIQRVNGQDKVVSAFERGLSVSTTATVLGFSCSTVSHCVSRMDHHPVVTLLWRSEGSVYSGSAIQRALSHRGGEREVGCFMAVVKYTAAMLCGVWDWNVNCGTQRDTWTSKFWIVKQYICENVGMVHGYLKNNPVKVVLFCDIRKGSRTR